MAQEVYIIDDKGELVVKLKEIFKNEKGYNFISVKCDEMEKVLENIPALIIVEDDNTEMNAVDICKIIRDNDDNDITPVIVLSSVTDHDYRIKILDMSIQQYIVKPIDCEYFYYTVKNIIDFVVMNRRVSPLTGLPGNVQIQTELKKRLFKKNSFAVMYYDLDNFKAYNDVYGFSNGDEVLKFMSKIIVKHIHDIEYGDSFIGHIGGDDFVSVIDKYDYDKLCSSIINDFDENIINFYTSEDIERGYVEVANRRGIIEKFPIMTISIAVVEVENGNFKTPLEIGEISAQVKHAAKEKMGSAYVINRRKKK